MSIDFDSMPGLTMLAKLGDELGIDPDFLSTVANEDDWSFVIKLHALIEAAATHLLTKSLMDDRLRDAFSRLEMSNQTTGKLAFIKALELLDSDSRRYIQKLSELRNAFVHNVGSVGMRIADYVEKLSDADAKGLLKGFNWGHKDTSTIKVWIDEEHGDIQEALKAVAVVLLDANQYKLAIWFGSWIVLRKMVSHARVANYTRELRDLDDEIEKLRETIAGIGGGLPSHDASTVENPAEPKSPRKSPAKKKATPRPPGKKKATVPKKRATRKRAKKRKKKGGPGGKKSGGGGGG